MRIDLNADLGESFGAYALGDDAAVMKSVTSVSVAAGFHAGDPSVMRATIRLARSLGVAVGAHPGFPDLTGFGRRDMNIPPSELEDLVLYQIAAVAGVAAAEGVRLQHVKAHGALYNLAARDLTVATAIARAVVAFDRGLVMFCAPGSALLTVARAEGLAVAAEAFADRAYRADGSLAPRSDPAGVIHDADVVVARAIRMVREKTVVALDGSSLPMAADSLCLHGDTTDAGALAARLRGGLEASGITIRAVGRR